MNDEKVLEPARMALANYLKERNMRRTPERFAILEKVFSTDAHFYVDALYEAMELEGYHVSLSTVYATVQLLLDAGLVRQHKFPNQPAQYERVVQGVTENHHHLVCTSCGKVKAVKSPELARGIAAMRYPSFKAEYFAIYVYGLCNRCQKRLKKLNLST